MPTSAQPTEVLAACGAAFAESGASADGIRAARALTELGRLPEAAALCESLAALPNTGGGPLLQLGRIRERQGRTEEAAAAYERALAIDEMDAPGSAARDAHALTCLPVKA